MVHIGDLSGSNNYVFNHLLYGSGSEQVLETPKETEIFSLENQDGLLPVQPGANKGK